MDGRILNFELSCTFVPGHEKDMTSAIVSLVDITERKKVEEEIKRLNRELENRIRKRTANSKNPIRSWNRSPILYHTTCAPLCVPSTVIHRSFWMITPVGWILRANGISNPFGATHP
jgi:hypothetical protein